MRRFLTVGAALCVATVGGLSPAQAAPVKWNGSKAGVKAWGTVEKKNGRVYIQGTVQDTATDKRAARIRLRFYEGSPDVPRVEEVDVTDGPRTRKFAFDSKATSVSYQLCTFARVWPPGDNCTRWLSPWG